MVSKLSELDYVVQHRAGFKKGHVDTLSRHLGVITNPDPLSRESVQQKQGRIVSVAEKTYGLIPVRVNSIWIAMTSCTNVSKTANIS